MDRQYEDLHKRAEKLKFRLRDKLDDKDSSLGRQITDELDNFISEIESKQNPRSLEDKAKNMQKTLDSAKNQGDQVMDYSDYDYFDDQLEEIRKNLQKFENH